MERKRFMELQPRNKALLPKKCVSVPWLLIRFLQGKCSFREIVSRIKYITIVHYLLYTSLLVSTKWLLVYRDQAKQTQFGVLNVSSDWKEHACRTLMMLKSPRPSPQPRLSDLFCRMFGIWGLGLGVLYTSLQGQPVDRRSLLWLIAPPARYQLPWRDYSFSPLFPAAINSSMSPTGDPQILNQLYV